MQKQTIITAAVVATVLAALFIAYQALVAVPRERIEAQTIQDQKDRAEDAMAAARREDKYNSCLVDAQSFYSADWNGHCELLEKEPDCSLPTNTALIFESRKEKAEEACLAVYKSN